MLHADTPDPSSEIGRALRIVVADNDPEALDLVMMDLRWEGHTVSGASSGAGVPELVESFDPDVVILDHRMPPGPSGLDVAIALRVARPQLRVLIYSNYQDQEWAHRAAEHDIPVVPKGNLRTLRRKLTDP